MAWARSLLSFVPLAALASTGAVAAQHSREDMEELVAEFDPPATRSLVGRLVTPEGRPHAFATLRIRGTPAYDRADKDGRFELSGSWEDPAILVVQLRRGPHFARVAPGSDASDELAWAIDGSAKPRPALPIDALRARDLALELLVGLVDPPDTRVENMFAVPAIRALATLDPMRALAIAQETEFSRPGDAERALAAVLGTLSDSSPREALALLDRFRHGVFRTTHVLRSAAALGGEDELEILEGLRGDLERSSSPFLQAECGLLLADRYVELRRGDLAASLRGRAVIAIDEVEDEHRIRNLRPALGSSLAAIDLSEGLAWIESGSSISQRARGYARTAIRIADTEPEAAASVFARAVASGELVLPEDWARAVAYELVDGDADVAREVARAHDPSGIALGLVALRLMENGRTEEARAVLDDAFRRAGERTTGRRSNEIAGLIVLSNQIDRPRIAERVGWALALRSDASSAAGRPRDAPIATALAPVDLELARALLTPAEERLRAHEPEDGSGARGALRDAWIALATIAPERAVRAARDADEVARLSVGVTLAAASRGRTTIEWLECFRISVGEPE